MLAQGLRNHMELLVFLSVFLLYHSQFRDRFCSRFAWSESNAFWFVFQFCLYVIKSLYSIVKQYILFRHHNYYVIVMLLVPPAYVYAFLQRRCMVIGSPYRLILVSPNWHLGRFGIFHSVSCHTILNTHSVHGLHIKC